jgi:colanic acid/amylovoran biosynthesis protein
MEEQFWLRFPSLNDLCINLRAMALGKTLPASPARFRKLLVEADMLAVCGGGYINDCFKESACDLLDELKAVLQAGIPVVAFGQGIGPITDLELEARARAVLPRMKMIGLREGLSSLPLLESLGVPRDRIHVTGDEAIEPALLRRPASLGYAIGINLRLADYAGTDEKTAEQLRQPLQRAAQALNSTLIPVLISFHNVFHNRIDSDREAVGRLLENLSQGSPAQAESPDDAIRMIGKCRVVVTGSYHGAVFALAQGIPVVGLLQSEYYEQKFTGLQQQFPRGCLLIDLRQPITSGNIEDAIHMAWESAESVRDSLIEAASRQVELGRALYQTAHAQFPLE